MNWLIGLVLVFGCGSPQPKPPAQPITPPVARPIPQLFRQLRVGRSTAIRATFALVIDGDRATLTETNERSERGLTLVTVDAATWTTVATRTYAGTVKGNQLALQSAGVQPLALHCTTRSIDVAAAGALRVVGSNTDCSDKGVWDPPATTRVEALVCDAGGPDPDDDDLLVFGPTPGFEGVTVHETCVLQGLRIAR